MIQDDSNSVQLHYQTVVLTATWVLLTRGVIFTMALTVAYLYLKKQYCLHSSTGAFPEIKTPFFSIYGIFRVIPSYTTLKKLSLPPTALLQQVLSGAAVLYPDANVIVSKMGFQPLVLLTKAESVEEFMCKNVLITKPYKEVMLPFFGEGLFLSAGEKWKSRRRFLTPMFHYDILKGFVRVFDKESKVLVDILMEKCHKAWIDIVDPLAFCSMDIICKTKWRNGRNLICNAIILVQQQKRYLKDELCIIRRETFLGIDVGAQKESGNEFVSAMVRVTQTMLERYINPLYRIKFVFALSRLGRQFKEDITYLREIALQVVHQRKEERRLLKEGHKHILCNAEVMDLLLDDEENNSDITEDLIRDEIMSFIFAGEDTTAAGLSWTLYLIGLYPEIQTKIHEELDAIFGDDHDRAITAEDLKQMCYLECVIKESQRLYPSVPYNGKYTLEDCTLSGYRIKKGSVVLVSVYDLHRNPEIFPNPEVFDPDRFLPENSAGRSPYVYVPFSGGMRSCLGRRYAMMELKTVVANVLHKFSLKSLEPRDKIYVSVEIILRSPHPLKVKFIPRHITDAKK